MAANIILGWNKSAAYVGVLVIAVIFLPSLIFARMA
jgi:hypothetical protein